MEEIVVKQNIPNTSTNQLETLSSKAKPNRHVSVLYGMQYLSRVPIVKRCRKTEYECFANINKKQIFVFLHSFVQKLLSSQNYLKQLFSDLKFSDNQVDATIIQTKPNDKRCSILSQVSDSSANKKSIFQEKYLTQFNDKKATLQVPNKGKSCKKISIMIDGSFNNLSDSQLGSALFSEQSITNLSSINIPYHEFTLKMVEKIYQQPQPFLINLSVCLMLKYLYFSQVKLSLNNVCWILSIGTIVAYKIYYDEPVEGLVESFAYILKIKKEDIINLERHFLGEIDHEAVISNQQYHSVLYQIIKQGGGSTEK